MSLVVCSVFTFHSFRSMIFYSRKLLHCLFEMKYSKVFSRWCMFPWRVSYMLRFFSALDWILWWCEFLSAAMLSMNITARVCYRHGLRRSPLLTACLLSPLDHVEVCLRFSYLLFLQNLSSISDDMYPMANLLFWLFKGPCKIPSWIRYRKTVSRGKMLYIYILSCYPETDRNGQQMGSVYLLNKLYGLVFIPVVDMIVAYMILGLCGTT